MKKTWIIIILVIIAALIAGILILKNGETSVDPTTTPGKTIQQPGGGKATLKFEGPPELEMSFEEFKVEMGEFRVVGTVKNVSSDSTIVIELSGVGIFVKGEQVAALFNPEKELKPGDTWKIQKGFIYLVPEEEEVDMFVRVINFRKVETQPTNTPTETTKLTNIETPEGIAIKWLEKLKAGDYDIINFYTPEIKEKLRTAGLEAISEAYENRKIVEMEYNGNEEDGENFTLYFLANYADGVTGDRVDFLFIHNGEWKISHDPVLYELY